MADCTSCHLLYITLSKKRMDNIQIGCKCWAYGHTCSDDSDDSEGGLEPGISLDANTHDTALTIKNESCDQGDGLADGKPLNGVLPQGKGKMYWEMC